MGFEIIDNESTSRGESVHQCCSTKQHRVHKMKTKHMKMERYIKLTTYYIKLRGYLAFHKTHCGHPYKRTCAPPPPRSINFVLFLVRVKGLNMHRSLFWTVRCSLQRGGNDQRPTLRNGFTKWWLQSSTTNAQRADSPGYM